MSSNFSDDFLQFPLNILCIFFKKFPHKISTEIPFEKASKQPLQPIRKPTTLLISVTPYLQSLQALRFPTIPHTSKPTIFQRTSLQCIIVLLNPTMICYTYTHYYHTWTRCLIWNENRSKHILSHILSLSPTSLRLFIVRYFL